MTVLEISKDNFEDEVLNSKQKVLVDFNAGWCGPCKVLKPIFEEVAESNNDIKFASVDIDNEEELAEQYDVSSIPCLVLFEEGKEVERKVGFISKSDIEKMIKE